MVSLRKKYINEGLCCAAGSKPVLKHLENVKLPVSGVKKIRPIPFDVAATEMYLDWHEYFRWPLPFSEVAQALDAQMRRYVDYVAGLKNTDTRHVVLLAAPALLTMAHFFLETAICLQAAEHGGLAFEGGPEELTFLRGGRTLESLPPPRSVAKMRLGSRPRLAWLRHLKISAGWLGRRLPPVFFSRAPVAIANSPLIRTLALQTGAYFNYPDSLLNLNSAPWKEALPVDAASLAEELATSLSDAPELAEPYRTRLRSLLLRESISVMKKGAKHLAAVDSLRCLPKDLWTGTTGNYLSRLLGLGAVRRGHNVVTFSHAGATPLMFANSNFMAVIDLCVSRRYVLPTDESVRLAQESGITEHPLVSPGMTFSGLDGDSMFQAVPKKKTSPGRRLKVLYVLNLIRGLYQYLDPLLPDPVYLAWQARLIGKLKRLPVELICRPHPEGVMGGSEHPVTQYAHTSHVPFGELLDWADLFVFDYFATTALFEAMCTRKPVVFIDVNTRSLRPEIERPFLQRCRVIHAHEDENNVPDVGFEELAEAVNGNSKEGDPTFFRRLLAGNA